MLQITIGDPVYGHDLSRLFWLLEMLLVAGVRVGIVVDLALVPWSLLGTRLRKAQARKSERRNFCLRVLSFYSYFILSNITTKL